MLLIGKKLKNYLNTQIKNKMSKQMLKNQIQIKKITKGTLIAEILAENPEKAQLLAEIMMDFGIHCIGCGAAAFETLEQGVLGHGYSKKDLDKLIKELNKILGESSKSEKLKNIKNFSLKFTSPAIKKIKQIIKSEKNKNAILRISILPGGCSGHVYNLEIINKQIKTDLSLKQEGLNISIDKNSLEFLNGTEINFVDNLKESGFKFNNPNAHKECGCGKSFG